MTDENAGAGTTKKIEAVADRQWIDAFGQEVEADEATGFKYVDKASNKFFVWQSGHHPGTALTMLAIFGGLTKAGNIRNTLVNSKNADPNADVIGGISDWFSELDNGIWAAERTGGGIRVNAEVLAQAIAEAKGETDPSPYKARIDNRDKVKDPGDKNGKKEILYSTFALRNKTVEGIYQRLLPSHGAAPDVSAL
jgi:hypothetical protein